MVKYETLTAKRYFTVGTTGMIMLTLMRLPPDDNTIHYIPRMQTR